MRELRALNSKNERSHDSTRFERKMRGLMNFRLKIAAATMLAVSVVASYGQTSEATPPVKKHVATKTAKTPAPPTVADQIQALKEELEGQINSLKTDWP